MNHDPDGEPPSSTPQRIKCRPASTLRSWFLVAFFFVIGALPLLFIFFFPNPYHVVFDWSQYALFALGAVLCWPLASLYGWWLLRGFIIADEAGVSWRGIGRRHSATWPEVEDYWIVSGRGTKLPRVQTAQGQFSIRDMRHSDALCDFIQKHARWSKAREWQIKELDFAAGRHEFAYGPKELRTARVFVVMGVLLIPIMFLPLATSPSGISGIWRALRDPLSLLPLLLYLVMALSVSLVCIIPFWLIACAIQERRDQRIFADQEGLTFESRDGFIRARWDDVTDYYSADIGTWLRLPSRYVVVTKSGTFDFVRIDKGAQLCALIQRCATSAAHSNWLHDRTSDSLVNEDALWSGGSPGVGQRVYGYRTRTNRALLFFGTFFTLLFLTIAVLSTMGINLRAHGEPDTMTPFVLAIGFGIVTLLGVAAYYGASIRTDERGLEKRTVFSRRFITWSQVRELQHQKADIFTHDIVKGDSTIRFSPYTSDVEELYDEIARRTGLEWGASKRETPKSLPDSKKKN